MSKDLLDNAKIQQQAKILQVEQKSRSLSKLEEREKDAYKQLYGVVNYAKKLSISLN